MATWNWSRSSAATICAHVAPDGDFKACCLESGGFDGANRNDYFQGVSGASRAVSLTLRLDRTPQISGFTKLKLAKCVS
jgi:hypothetical protein